MRGNKRLVQGITVAGATGMLALSVTISQPQIRQTEGTVQIMNNGLAGHLSELHPDEQIGEVPAQALTIEKHNIFKVAASMDDVKASFEEPSSSEADSQIKAAAEKKAEEITSNDKTQAEQENDAPKAADANDKDSKNSIDQNQSDLTEKSSGSDKEEASDADKKSGQDEKKETEDNSSKKSESKESKNDTKTDKSETKKEEKNSTKTSESKTNNDTKKTEKKGEKKVSEAEKWANKLMADVSDRLNIRKSSNENSKIVGKLRKGDVATIIEKGKKWTKIKSGSVTGYVKNSYCVFGEKAYKLAKKICKTYATVQTDGLRVRKKPSEKATILDAAFKGDRLTVVPKADTKDGWVVVKLNGLKGYVSDEYVKVGLGTSEAISIQEEIAQLAAKKKADEDAARAAAQNTSGASAASVSSNNAVSTNSSAQVSASDLTLLSAIIFCEAGGESYEGQVAVGAVVMNRVKSGSFPNSISSVVYQSGQFSPVGNGSLSRALSNGNYQYCTSAARAALAGSDNTGGAKFFHRANGAAGLVIGNHVFY